MNPDPLEQELRKLRPAKPPAGVTRRARGLWAAPPAPVADLTAREVLAARLRLWRTVSAGLGVCTGVLLALLMTGRQPGPADRHSPAARMAPASTPARLVPVDVERTVLRTAEEGIFASQDARPVRHVRVEFLETERLLDVEDAAWIHRSVPREAVLKLPVRTD